MTREEIEQLNGVEPYCIETDREQSWYEFGLVQGLETADENPKSPWISVKDDLPCYYTEFYRRIGNILYTRKCLVILSDGSIMITSMISHENKWKWDTVGNKDVLYWFLIPESPKE